MAMNTNDAARCPARVDILSVPGDEGEQALAGASRTGRATVCKGDGR
jgi:hypothetical protein